MLEHVITGVCHADLKGAETISVAMNFSNVLPIAISHVTLPTAKAPTYIIYSSPFISAQIQAGSGLSNICGNHGKGSTFSVSTAVCSGEIGIIDAVLNSHWVSS
eukprot:TRINITY_DN17662_c0_g1_i1.p3 TRINITY_DN17662_c0_g1~~TRINITY_DN17662_c0_g1_i1.p3  ORF type:complete len:104 (+),score=20.99 TRINITY_DN17662_c0_g1_i1:164-475(+)